MNSARAAGEIARIADEFLAAFARRHPESTLPGAAPDLLFDNSLPAYRAWWAREDAWLDQLRRIDADALHGTPEWVLYGVLREQIEVSVEGRVCRRHLWWLDTDYPLGALHVGDLPELATRQPVGTAEARAASLRRWVSVPRFLETEITNLREGIRQGYTAPRLLVGARVEELDRLLAMPVDEAPFYDPARRDSTAEFQQQTRILVEQRILPALQRFRDFLSHEYSRPARETLGLSALPEGAACWRAQLRRQLTGPLDPATVDSIGRALLESSVSTRDSIARAAYGLPDGSALAEKLATDTAHAFSSLAEAADSMRLFLQRVARILPRYFGRLPTELVPAVEVASLEPGITAMQVQGRVLLNERAIPPRINRINLPSIALHEGIPGHYLQWAIAQEKAEAHPLVRQSRRLPAFAEGWAVYAAGPLGREMGVLSGDGVNAAEANSWVAGAVVILVVNGIHAHGWTSSQVLDTLNAYIPAPPGVNESGLSYFVGWPGHAFVYPMGAAEIQRIRNQAEAALGPRFDLRDFHDVVLEDGRITLGMLREKVARWIAEK